MKAITVTRKPPSNTKPAYWLVKAEGVKSLRLSINAIETAAWAAEFFAKAHNWLEGSYKHLCEGTLPDGKTSVFVFSENPQRKELK